MKTLLPMGSKLMLAIAGFLCVIGCANQSKKSNASAEVVVTHVASAPAPTVIIAANAPASPPTVAPVVAASAPTNPIAVATMAITNAQPTEIIPPVMVPISPGLAEIVRLYQSKVEESVILSFIEASKNPYKPTADEIVYMNDLGISSKIMVTIIQKGQKLREEEAQKILDSALAAQEAAANTPTPGTVGSQYVGATTAPNTPPPTVTTTMVDPNQQAAAYAQPAVTYVQQPQTYVEQPAVSYVQAQSYVEPQTANVGYFYDSLAPYGSWMHMPGYGWVWQPSVVAVNPSWQPYYDNGRWLYTDSGWYWHSSYSWGWAPFHYGRWFQHAHRGWMWCPDTMWGPSWVSWRYTPGYCGWAPLPPGAGFAVGRGWNYHGAYVGSDCDFGLSYVSFSFVSYDHFYSDRWHRHGIRGGHGQHIYRDSKLANNYFMGPNKTMINEGIPRDHMVKYSRTEISKVSLKDMPSNGPRSAKPERFDERNKSLTVYRPEMAKGIPPRPTINSSASSAPTGNTRVPVSATEADVSKRPAANRAEVSKNTPVTTPNNSESSGNRRGEGRSSKPQAGPQTITPQTANSPVAITPSGGRSEVSKSAQSIPANQNAASPRGSTTLTMPQAVPQNLRPSQSPVSRPQPSPAPTRGTGLTSSPQSIATPQPQTYSAPATTPSSPARITTVTPRSEVSKQQSASPAAINSTGASTPSVTTSTMIGRNGQVYSAPIQGSPAVSASVSRNPGSTRQEVFKTPSVAPAVVPSSSPASTTISRPPPTRVISSGNGSTISSPSPMTVNPYGSPGNRPVSTAPPVMAPSRSFSSPTTTSQPSGISRSFDSSPVRSAPAPVMRSAPSISVQPSPSMQRSAPVMAPTPARSSPPPSISVQPSSSRPAPAAASSTSGSDPNRNRRN